MTRNYGYIEQYLDKLYSDVYAQPPDDTHTALARQAIERFVKPRKIESALDIGCGQGFTLPMLAEYADQVVGVTLGDDYAVCRAKGLNVQFADMSFLPFEAGSFDLIFARHVLEHSPMPLLTLMEWRRVARQYLLLIVPSLDSFEWYGRNHYYVLLPPQWRGLIERAGWRIIEYEESSFEHRFFCEVSDGHSGSFRTHPKDA